MSNGHFVQWSNGSWSLVIGDKIFDMTVHSLEDEHVFLYAPVQQTAVLQDVGRVQERFIVKRVTEAGRKRAPIKSMRESRVKMAVTIKDPEKMKIEMERASLCCCAEKQEARLAYSNLFPHVAHSHILFHLHFYRLS